MFDVKNSSKLDPPIPGPALEHIIIPVHGKLDLLALIWNHLVNGHPHRQERVLSRHQQQHPAHGRYLWEEGPQVGVHGQEGAVGDDGGHGGQVEGGVPGANVADGAGRRLAREAAKLVRVDLELEQVVEQRKEA